tara:strand:+ start:22402 stop:23835 length:1434 start_codon:yes stop_codon:yes gene_type:complete
MNLIDAIQQRDTKTQNGMTTNSSSLNHCVNLFFQIGAMRGMDKKRLFAKVSKAFNEDPLTTIKIIFWARDVRGGAGERQIFRDCLSWLCDNRKEVLNNNIHLISEYGRWDDVLTLVGSQNCWYSALDLIKTALENKDGLCAKWMPRKGDKANIIRRYLKLSPKKYRKLLVKLTNVVETKMCAKDWKSIEYSKLPSLASSRYQRAFMKNDEIRYEEYKDSLLDGKTKINASAVYPYDIIKSIKHGGEKVVAQAQWESLPNYMEGISERVLPVVDVSGSMETPAGNNGNVTCMDVSTSLGMYISERNEGVFKNAFITFSSKPQLQLLEGSLTDKLNQLERADWGMNTDLQSTFKLILNQAVKHNVPVSEMPTKVLILSDMEFDQAISENWDDVSEWNPTAQEMIKGMYEEAGYEMPGIVYWNIQSRQDNVPTRFDEMGTALVSGFSPSIMKTILSCEELTPYKMMIETIGSTRYESITV